MGDIIDVSEYQQQIDWSKVPYDTAIIRVGYRTGSTGKVGVDPYAIRNLNGARAAGKKVGAYFFTQAINEAEAIEEADFAAAHAGRLHLPLYIDTEYANKNHTGRADKLDKATRSRIVQVFCRQVKAHGYKSGVYASESWYKNQIDISPFRAFIDSVWVAKYSTKAPSYPPLYDYWQYTSKATCAGINGYVDLSRSRKMEPEKKKDILIGQASMGETGISNQKAGNQTGQELNIRKYSNHKKGWRAFRHSWPGISDKIAYAVLRAVKNACIGYDQKDRNTIKIVSQKYGYDPGCVKVDCECDCGTLVWVAIAYAGILLPDFTTGNEANVLLNHGFQEIPFDPVTGEGLRVGDILVTKTKGHTCVVVQA